MCRRELCDTSKSPRTVAREFTWKVSKVAILCAKGSLLASFNFGRFTKSRFHSDIVGSWAERRDKETEIIGNTNQNGWHFWNTNFIKMPKKESQLRYFIAENHSPGSEFLGKMI